MRRSGIVLSFGIALAVMHVAPSAQARSGDPDPQPPTRTRVFPAHLDKIMLVCRSMGIEVVELVSVPGQFRIHRTRGMKRSEEVLRKVADDLHASLEWRSDGRVAIIHKPLPAERREKLLLRLRSDDSTVAAGAMREMARSTDLGLLEEVVKQADAGEGRARQAALAIADASRLDEAWRLDSKRALTALALESPWRIGVSSAFRYLKDIKEPELVDLLAATLERGSKYYSSGIVSCLASLGGPRARDGLKAAFSDPDSREREAVAERLGWADLPDDEVLAMCRRAMRDPSAQIRCEITKSLDRFETARVLDFYDARLVGDPAAYVRKAAADALGEIAVEGALPHIEVLLDDDDRKVRTAALQSLGKICAPRTIELFAAMVDAPEARSNAMEALAKLDVDAAWLVLERAVVDDDPTVSVAAIRTLARRSGPRTERVLRAALHDPREHVRNAALWGLFEIDVAGAVDMALKAVKNKDHTVRERAARYLGEQETPGRKALLRRLAGDDDPLVRWGAALAIGSMGARDMLPVIAGLATDKDTDVRTVVMGSMMHFPGPGEHALDALARGIRDAEGMVRITAVRSLRRFDGPKALDLMGRVLEDDIENNARDAVKYIARKRSPR
ncbi:MAG: HEAT repeat domain-containing protein, partial [Planctomycetota bacterium]